MYLLHWYSLGALQCTRRMKAFYEEHSLPSGPVIGERTGVAPLFVTLGLFCGLYNLAQSLSRAAEI